MGRYCCSCIFEHVVAKAVSLFDADSRGPRLLRAVAALDIPYVIVTFEHRLKHFAIPVPHMAPNEIGLVVRGHVMRRGGEGTLNADGNYEDLKLVLHSIRINAASPSTSISFVAVDVVWLDCTTEQVQQLRRLVRSYLNFPHSSIFVRVSKESLGSI